MYTVGKWAFQCTGGPSPRGNQPHVGLGQRCKRTHGTLWLAPWRWESKSRPEEICSCQLNLKETFHRWDLKYSHFRGAEMADLTSGSEGTYNVCEAEFISKFRHAGHEAVTETFCISQWRIYSGVEIYYLENNQCYFTFTDNYIRTWFSQALICETCKIDRYEIYIASDYWPKK